MLTIYKCKSPKCLFCFYLECFFFFFPFKCKGKPEVCVSVFVSTSWTVGFSPLKQQQNHSRHRWLTGAVLRWLPSGRHGLARVQLGDLEGEPLVINDDISVFWRLFTLGLLFIFCHIFHICDIYTFVCIFLSRISWGQVTFVFLAPGHHGSPSHVTWQAVMVAVPPCDILWR